MFRIRAKLQASFIFNALASKEIEIVVGAMEEKQFASGQTIIKQGEEGNNLFVVDSGVLTCTRIFVPYCHIFFVGRGTRA